MTNFLPNSQQPLPKEGDVFTKTVIFILVVSAAIFVMPAIAIILIADAFAVGGGSTIAINMTIAAAVLAVILPIVFAICRRIGGASAIKQSLVLQRDVALLQQEVLELRHQTLVVSESAEFSKQLLMSKERTSADIAPSK
jgi:uncharacterized membrane protein YfbV (UPF0208 family)